MKKFIFPLSFLLMLTLLAVECGKEDPIVYPETGDYGDNILRESDVEINVNTNPNPDLDIHYSFCADLPEESSLKVVVKNDDGMYSYEMGFVVGWSISVWENGVQNFLADGSNYCDLELTFYGSSDASIKIYENGSEEPTRVKNISC